MALGSKIATEDAWQMLVASGPCAAHGRQQLQEQLISYCPSWSDSVVKAGMHPCNFKCLSGLVAAGGAGILPQLLLHRAGGLQMSAA